MGHAFIWEDSADARAEARRARLEAAKRLGEIEGREPRVDEVVEGLRKIRGEDRFGEAIVRAMRLRRKGRM